MTEAKKMTEQEISHITEEHEALVKALVKNPNEIMDQMNPTRAALLHAAIGISGEASEIVLGVSGFHPHQDKEKQGKDLLNELGDMVFYLQDLANIIGLGSLLDLDLIVKKSERMGVETMGELFQKLIGHTEEIDEGGGMLIVILSGRVLDLVKKVAIYNQELNGEVKGSNLSILETLKLLVISLTDLVIYTAHSLHLCGREEDGKWISEKEEALAVIRRANIEKLVKRYPNGYSDKSAKERLDEEMLARDKDERDIACGKGAFGLEEANEATDDTPHDQQDCDGEEQGSCG